MPTPKTDDNSQKALGADLVTSLYGLDGTGITIGVISDSFNTLGGAAGDVESKDLPNNVNVLWDDPLSGVADEGRAMIELAYKIAPGASFAFASGAFNPATEDTNLTACAQAVNALSLSANCKIIVDDLGFVSQEPFFQVGTQLDTAIQNAVGKGTDYFSAAGNDGISYYEAGFNGVESNLGVLEQGNYATFGNGTPYLSVTIPRTVEGFTFVLQWAQPFATIGNSPGAQNSLAFYLLDATGKLVAGSDIDERGKDPIQAFNFVNKTASTAFSLVVEENGGVVPAGQLFKIIVQNPGVTFNDPDANSGSGNIFGHELLTDQNSVGAVSYTQTPAFGVSNPTPTNFTSVGPGSILFDQSGAAITPVDAGMPDFVAPQGSSTAVPGFAPFTGTSAAAPNAAAVAALMLQANAMVTGVAQGALGTVAVTALMQQSAIPVTTSVADAGAGLLQARAAVELADAAGGNLWSAASGGDWANPNNWTGGTVPTSAQPAMLGYDGGAITTAYQVIVDLPGATAGALTVNAAGTAQTTLNIIRGGDLSIGGTKVADPTAGDLLVARGGVLSVLGGSLAVAGSLNTNDGTVSIGAGTATADNYAQIAGSLVVGGAGTADLVLAGGGLSETGGSVAVTAGGVLDTTTLSISNTTFSVQIGAAVAASGAVALTSQASFQDGGQVTVAAAMTVDTSSLTVLGGGMLSVQGLYVGSSVANGAPASVTIGGTLTDSGILAATGSVAGAVTLQQGGRLALASSMEGVSVGFDGGGLLDFSSADSTVLTTELQSTLSGFEADQGAIDFSGLLYSQDDTYSYNAGAFSLLDEGTVLANLNFVPSTGDTFSVGNDGEGGILVTAVACYCRGTSILTSSGERTVESIAIGDTVVTAHGEHRRIRWIGTRAYAGPFLAANPKLQPVRFRAGSLGGGLPRRDLLVSPEHAMFLDGVLVPAKLLVNGDTVAQETALGSVDYFHIELDSHDVILAEGAPSETFVDCDSRFIFQNAHSFTGTAPRWSFCAPRVEGGLVLDRIRDRLRRRPTDPETVPAVGYLDWATHEQCVGWAYLPGDEDAKVEVEILVDGAVMARVMANGCRPDVAMQGFGTGRNGFTLVFARPLPRFQPHRVTARAMGGGALIGAVELSTAAKFDTARLPEMADALQAHAATPGGGAEIGAFLREQLRICSLAGRARSALPLALVLDDAVPRLAQSAGSTAILSHVAALQRLGYQVVFVPLDGIEGPLPAGVRCAARPAYVCVEEALRQHRKAALVYVHRVAGMAAYGPLIRAACPEARLLYSVADLHFLRVGRQAAVEGSAIRMAESRRLREQELAAARLADVTVTHSAEEAVLLRRLVPGASVRVVPWHVPAEAAPYAWRRRSGLLFVGGMAHAPNADAVRWLAAEVMPRVVARNKRIRCKIVGAGLTDADKTWLHPAMDVLGPVENLARLDRSARLAVAPLRFGSGVKGKVLEAFAAGLPCVMTPVAAEGLDLPTTMQELVASDADTFASRIVALHDREQANLAAGAAGRAIVTGRLSECMVDAALGDAAASAASPQVQAGSGGMLTRQSARLSA